MAHWMTRKYYQANTTGIINRLRHKLQTTTRLWHKWLFGWPGINIRLWHTWLFGWQGITIRLCLFGLPWINIRLWHIWLIGLPGNTIGLHDKWFFGCQELISVYGTNASLEDQKSLSGYGTKGSLGDRELLSAYSTNAFWVTRNYYQVMA